MPDLKDLTYDGKEELALALLLWRDFKASGKIRKFGRGLIEN